MTMKTMTMNLMVMMMMMMMKMMNKKDDDTSMTMQPVMDEINMANFNLMMMIMTQIWHRQ